jgi:hypothetical protein
MNGSGVGGDRFETGLHLIEEVEGVLAVVGAAGVVDEVARLDQQMLA